MYCGNQLYCYQFIFTVDLLYVIFHIKRWFLLSISKYKFGNITSMYARANRQWRWRCVVKGVLQWPDKYLDLLGFDIMNETPSFQCVHLCICYLPCFVYPFEIRSYSDYLWYYVLLSPCSLVAVWWVGNMSLHPAIFQTCSFILCTPNLVFVKVLLSLVKNWDILCPGRPFPAFLRSVKNLGCDVEK